MRSTLVLAHSPWLPSLGRRRQFARIPAESPDRVYPYDAQVLGCADQKVLGRIQGRFESARNPLLEFGTEARRLRAYPRDELPPQRADLIPRRYCTGRAILSDNSRARIDYNICRGPGHLRLARQPVPRPRALPDAELLQRRMVHLRPRPAPHLRPGLPDGAPVRRPVAAVRAGGAHPRGGRHLRAGATARRPGRRIRLLCSRALLVLGLLPRSRVSRRAGSNARRAPALGFTVHGLWPPERARLPDRLRPAGADSPSRAAMDIAREVIPSEGLARHQWRKHGTCSGASPTDYFRDVKTARAKVTIPKEFEKPSRDSRWTPIDLERAFIAANPGLRADMIAISCRRNVWTRCASA